MSRETSDKSSPERGARGRRSFGRVGRHANETGRTEEEDGRELLLGSAGLEIVRDPGGEFRRAGGGFPARDKNDQCRRRRRWKDLFFSRIGVRRVAL